MIRPLALALLAATALAPAKSQPVPQSPVPVTTVVLFSSGVGYFEHSGTVRGSGATELRFRTAQMNDLLKSLILQDLDGGKVSTITYPSQDPLSKTLRSFQVDITSNPSLAQLLNQLRGARITVQAQAERLSGTILGVETRTREGEKGGPAVTVPILNILTGVMIRSVELQAITSLSLDDPQLGEELAKALSSLTQARDQDKKPVTINFTGTGDRRVRIGYVVESPIWKTSYRLLLDEGTARLQGWGIIENQTESDWNNVSLSLVSGRPISFVMDLYSPMYLDRPTVVPELYASLRPRVYDGGIAMDSISRAAGFGGRGGGGGGRGGSAAGARQEASRMDAERFPLGAVVSTAAPSPMNAAESVESRAQGSRMGELFQYTVGNVTLPRQKSAMIPIVTEKIEIERVSIYNASVLGTNPLNGVRLKNTTDKNLLQGPLTVLDRGNYAGDARIDNLPAGQERLLSYGIDLEMLVNSTAGTQTDAVVSAAINKGSLLLSRKYQSSQTYHADNKSDKDKTLVIEHPVRHNWKIFDSAKPYETTASVHRFKVSAPAQKVTSTTIREEVVVTETVAMLSADVGQLVAYSRSGSVPQAVRDAIGRAVQLKQAVIDADRQIAARTQQISEIGSEQNRIRENMKTVGQNSQYYQRLLAKLNEQESEIEKIQRERDEAIGRRDAARRQLTEYLSTLTVG